nr:hypothetical protein [Erwinia sp. Ejp617]
MKWLLTSIKHQYHNAAIPAGGDQTRFVLLPPQGVLNNARLKGSAQS